MWVYVNILPAAFLLYEMYSVYNLIFSSNMRFRFNEIIEENSPRIDANASSSIANYSFAFNSVCKCDNC